MEAILNNYFFNPEDTTYKAEFDTMQLWRQQAKLIARQAIDAEKSE